jgi:hypothetical protein
MSPDDEIPVRVPKKTVDDFFNRGYSQNNNSTRLPVTDQNTVKDSGSIPTRTPIRPAVQPAPTQPPPAIRISDIEQEQAQIPAAEPAPASSLRQIEPTRIPDSSPAPVRRKPRKREKARIKPRAAPRRAVRKPQAVTPSKSKTNFSNYRYRTRLLKGSILPILYGIISIRMLNRYVLEFPDTFEYEIFIILAGFLLGFGSLTGLIISNLTRSKRNPQIGAELKFSGAIVAFLPFLLIGIILMLFFGLATAWQFSTGFFLTALFPVIFVTLIELNAKGKFYVREFTIDPSKGRKLIFVK